MLVGVPERRSADGRGHPSAPDLARSTNPNTICSAASLDHTIWFHRPLRADRWHLHDFACHHFVGGRGLAIGHIFGEDGVHVATVAQEVLVRDLRDRTDGTAAELT